MDANVVPQAPLSGGSSPTTTSPATALNGQPTLDEVARIHHRRKLARKTPEQRRKLLQYQRRHNEKDERLFYCDYCDLFISSRQKTWAAHLRSARHMDAFRAYYDLAAHVESVWFSEINYAIEQARGREVHRLQQQRAGRGASTPLAAQRIAPGIVVGGALPPPPPPPPPPAVLMPSPAAAVAVRVGVGTPCIRVGGKVVMSPPLPIKVSVGPPPQEDVPPKKEE
ncbi:putative U1 small nuclear ribonucleoprotein C [Leptomonas pyrrhocoris]|uniref:Putative U1 small nuclear ribonucleoprotein C n=1 Tax=Leptomonas pyrrhocoris TaxID=157538 RepID=A0A0M9FXX3_LEPPY|nr:putative U1 small nuclear ribonucleoprotein C [Leptomonas pyrrhocoris]KPA78146.1 putative U1 small nuclear ribonucleoprotein C [Leptomonas pyrrhocoris]|eukprot:XP_015656585.1 putative U1 small nuclear ribonucleoprotein C [Leptomonas pyrrhocoris]